MIVHLSSSVQLQEYVPFLAWLLRGTNCIVHGWECFCLRIVFVQVKYPVRGTSRLVRSISDLVNC